MDNKDLKKAIVHFLKDGEGANKQFLDSIFQNSFEEVNFTDDEINDIMGGIHKRNKKNGLMKALIIGLLFTGIGVIGIMMKMYYLE